MRLSDEIFMICCISAYVIFASSLIKDSTLQTFSGANGRCHSTIMVIAFQPSCTRHELSEPPENSGFSRRSISKTMSYTFKALLKRLSSAVVIIYHSSKIPSRKVNTAGRMKIVVLNKLKVLS